MPFTPFHWGIPYVLGEFLLGKDYRKQRFQLLGLLAATISDFEGLFYFLGVPGVQLHGPLHSFIGGLLIGVVLLGFAMWLQQRYADMHVTEDDFLPRYFKWKINLVEKIYIIVSPVLYQISMDMWMYEDMELFWPFSNTSNDLASQTGELLMFNLGSFFLVVAVFIFIYNFIKSMVKYMNFGDYESQ